MLLNVSSPEHEAFCEGLSATHHLKIEREGNQVTFIPSLM